jgi:uncharacterized protein
MTITMYRASVPVFTQMLTALSAILKKAADHCAAKKIDPAVLVGGRLYPDMFALARQVQIASDHAKGAAARLAGKEVPSYPDTETTFEELQARIAKTLAYIGGFKPADIDGSEEKTVTVTHGSNSTTFKGEEYLLHFALPNFYFHVTTAFAILRHNGVEIGKRDYMGMAPKK